MTTGESINWFPVYVQEWLEGKREDAALSSIFGHDDRFPHIDKTAIEAVLDGNLRLVAGWDSNRLALAVRRALGMTTPRPEALPSSYQGNATTRDNIMRLAEQMALLADEMASLGDVETSTLAAVFNQSAWQTYDSLQIMLHSMSGTLELTANAIKIEKGKWRSSALLELRTRQAHYLSPIFESAFGQSATVNDRPGAKNLGVWPDFFSRILSLVDHENISQEKLRRIVKQARKRHMANPVKFS